MNTYYNEHSIKSDPVLTGLEDFLLPVCILDLQGNIRFANKAICQYLGLSADELANSTVFQLNPVLNSRGWVVFIRKLQRRKTGSQDTFHLHAYGRLILTEVQCAILNIDGSEYIQCAIIPRKPASSQGFYSSEVQRGMLRNFASNLPNGLILLYDKDLRYKLAEGPELENLHICRESIEGKTLHEIYSPEAVEMYLPLYKKALAGEASTLEVLGKNNRFYLIQISPVRNSLGEVEGGIAAASDIDDIKKAELSLQARLSHIKSSENLYRTLATGIPHGVIVIFDGECNCILAEGQGLDLLPAKKQALEGRHISEFSKKVDYERFEEAVEVTLAGVPSSFASTTVSGHWYQWTFIPYHDEEGTIRCGMIMGINIDNLKKAEDTNRAYIEELKNINNQLKIENGVRQLIQKNLQEQTLELESKNEELEQFAYVASHDLQEPLRMVSSYTQLLFNRYRDKLDSEAEEFINFAIEGSTRMQALINDLLSYSRVGRKEMSFEVINLEVVLKIVLHNLGLLIQETNAKVEFNKLPFVKGDASQLVQLLQNLISNAIKFRKPDVQPVITISAKAWSKQWKISVQDNGIGFCMNYKDRIFQIFQRLHTRDKFPGTGIGLAICKKITERHGGQIWVESEVNEGTVFHFTMPK